MRAMALVVLDAANLDSAIGQNGSHMGGVDVVFEILVTCLDARIYHGNGHGVVGLDQIPSSSDVCSPEPGVVAVEVILQRRERIARAVINGARRRKPACRIACTHALVIDKRVDVVGLSGGDHIVVKRVFKRVFDALIIG